MEPRGDGPDERVRDIVSQVTVKALREFTTGDMDDTNGDAGNETVAQPSSPAAAGSQEAPAPNGGAHVTELPMTDTQDLLGYNADDGLGNAEEEEGSSGSDGELEENEVVVLDPDHPLMRRFQQRLNEILQRRSEKLELELREIREAVTVKKKEREDIGVELYGVQQELARYQLTLENLQDSLNDLKRARELNEQQLNDARKGYKERQQTLTVERRRGADLRAELENISLRLFYLENAKSDVHSDIAVMKRAAEKAESEVSKAEEGKRQQDLFVSRLVERLDHLREDIALYDAQLEAQMAETKVAREALTEAKTEIETILVEKKQLFAAWNSALIGMRRRDEAHAAMFEALKEQQQRMLTIEMEIDAFRRLTLKEQQQNEQLTLVLNKTEAEIQTVKKMLSQCQAKYEALKEEYSTFSSILRETEEALKRVSADRNLCLTQLTELRKEIERYYQEKVRLEDAILEKMRQQLTADKATQYTERLLRRLRERTKELETQIATIENDIAKAMLENTQARAQIDLMEKKKAELEGEMTSKDQLVAKIQSEITKNNATIKRKTDQMEQLNAKIDKMVAAAGGVELGPLEIQINSLQKSIEAENVAIVELQQSWLRDQNELVRLTREHEEQSSAVDMMTKQHTILIQKKLRIEAEITEQRSETVGIEKEIHHLQVDLSKLDSLLYRERGAENILQQENQLLETHFMASLKDAERESIQLQDKLEGLKEEKERLLNSLVEAERQIMLWEKKTQLAKETRAAVDSDFGQGEIAAMKCEIHRMQVRYNQLMKQQEKMIQDMERTVSRREAIANRGDYLAKNSSAKVVTKGALHHQIADLRKKIKQTLQEATSCDTEIREFKDQQQHLGTDLDERQVRIQQLQSTLDTLDGDIERLAEQKQLRMVDLLSYQQKTKYYQQLKENKYPRACKTVESLDAEKRRQDERMSQILEIVDRVGREYPHATLTLRKVATAYGSRAPGLVDSTVVSAR